MEWVETTGKTVAEARDEALDRLGVAEDDAEFEVLEEPNPGLFCRVRGEARVRARIRQTAMQQHHHHNQLDQHGGRPDPIQRKRHLCDVLQHAPKMAQVRTKWKKRANRQKCQRVARRNGFSPTPPLPTLRACA